MGRFWPEGAQWVSWLLAALAEGAVVMPWLLAAYASSGVAAWERGVPGAWLLLALFLAAALWERAGRGRAPAAIRRWWRPVGMALGAAAGYRLAFLALPAHLRPVSAAMPNLAWWFLPAVAYLWYRGASCGSGARSLQTSRRLTWQATAQAVAVLVLQGIGAGRVPGVQAYLTGCVLALYGAGLALLARVRSLTADGGGDGEENVRRRHGWAIPLLAAVTATAVAATTALSADGMRSAVHLLSGGLSRLLGVLGWLLGYAAYPFAWVLEYLLLPLFRRIGAGQKLEELLAEPLADPGVQPIPAGEPSLTPERLARFGAYLLLAGALAVGLLLLLRLRGREEETAAQEGEEERISLGFWPSLWADLKGWTARRRSVDAGESQSPDEEAEGGLEPVRRLYRRLQAMGGRAGRARNPGETPAAYARALAARLPEAAEAAGAVTEVYALGRYGPEPPDPQAVAAAQRTLDALDR